MKLNVLLPWICVLGLSAGLASVFVSSRAKDAELAKLHTENTQALERQTSLEEAEANARRQAEQIADLRKDNQELLRLRSEVGQLRTEKQQLSKKIQDAQNQVQAAQIHADQAMKAGSARAVEITRLQTEMDARLKAAGAQNQINMCINQLRQLDAAKQQWGLELNKTVGSMPAPQEILPYLPGNVMAPCPAGGAYVLNALGALPTCSTPGHALR